MKTREELINAAVVECLNMLYKYSVPSLSFDDLQAQVEAKKDYDKEYYMHHYLPKDLYNEIIERFQHLYGIERKWSAYCDTISEYLFKGGLKDVYKKDERGLSHREHEKTPALSEVIGEENASKVKELLDNCKRFYRFDYKVDSFDFSVGNYAPTTNKNSAEEYWKSQGGTYNFDDNEIKKKYYKEEYGDEDSDYDEEVTI